MSEEKKYLTLEEILSKDITYDIFIEPLEKWIKIKPATMGDRLEAERDAMKHPAYHEMNEIDRAKEVGRMLALKILVEPKITREQYLKAEDLTIQLLLDAVLAAYYDKVLSLQDGKGEKIRRFLEQKMEDLAGNS